MRLGKVLVSVFVVVFSNSQAGQTKNEVLFNCNDPGDSAVNCLACNIYHEARGEGSHGMWLVALATANRVEGDLYPLKNPGKKASAFGNQFCRVIYEQRRDRRTKKMTPMFSWTLDGKHDRVYNKSKWADSREIAQLMIGSHNGSGVKIPDITFGCQWYHHTSIKPYWKKSYFPTVKIGKHQCYAKDEDAYLASMGEKLPTIGLLRKAIAASK